MGNAIANTCFEAGDVGQGGMAFSARQELDTTNIGAFSFIWVCQNFDLDEMETFEDVAGGGSCTGIDSKAIYTEFEKIWQAIEACKPAQFIKVHSKIGRMSLETGVVCQSCGNFREYNTQRENVRVSGEVKLMKGISTTDALLMSIEAHKNPQMLILETLLSRCKCLEKERTYYK